MGTGYVPKELPVHGLSLAVVADKPSNAPDARSLSVELEPQLRVLFRITLGALAISELRLDLLRLRIKFLPVLCADHVESFPMRSVEPYPNRRDHEGMRERIMKKQATNEQYIYLPLA